MASKHIIAGIDIGNANVKTVVAEISRENLRPHVLGAGISQSNGLRKGMVVDMDETIENIRQSVGQAENMSGVKIKQAYVSINGLHIKNQVSHGVVAVSRADNEISQNDIDRVIEAATAINLPPNRQKIHVIPRSFTIDGHEHVKDPLGMKGVRIEADVLIIDGLAPYIHNLAKCVNENDIEVAEFVFSPLASAKAILDRNQKEHGVLTLDFGGGVSTASLFYEGDLVHTAILPIGSRHITNDLAVALRSSMDTAEKTKIQFGSMADSKSGKKNEIDLSELMEEEGFVIPRKHVAKVIEARVNELFDMINGELKKINQIRMIPAGLVICGGGANMPGLIQVARNRLGLPVRLANHIHFDGMTDQIKDVSFAVAAGLVLWGLEKESIIPRFFNKNNPLKDNNLIKKGIDWLKGFMP